MSFLDILPGKTIPYNLSSAEAKAFLQRNKGNSVLQHFLATQNPPYGVVVTEAGGYGEVLVAYDLRLQRDFITGAEVLKPYPGARLHLVDVTNLRLADGIKKSTYITPTGAAINQLTKDAKDILDDATSYLPMLLLAGTAFFLWTSLKPAR